MATSAQFFAQNPHLDPNAHDLQKILIQMRHDIDALQKVRQPIYGAFTFKPDQAPLALVFSSPTPTINPDSSAQGAVVQYTNDVSWLNNSTVNIAFYKPSNWKITSASLKLLFQNNVYNPGSGPVVTKAKYVKVLLNPTKTQVSSPDYLIYRYTAGTTLLSPFDVTTDLEEKSFSGFSSSGGFINAFTDNAWNFIVVQQETADTTASGFCQAILQLSGYQTP